MIVSILDLDNTLVNTEILKELRLDRKWQEIYSKINLTTINENTSNILNEIKETRVVVVTSSPRKYAEKVLEYHNLNMYEKIVAYHDVNRRKPYPDPYLKAIEGLEGLKEIRIYGDEQTDFTAAEALKGELNSRGEKIIIKKIGCSYYKDNNLLNVDEIRR